MSMIVQDSGSPKHYVPEARPYITTASSLKSLSSDISVSQGGSVQAVEVHTNGDVNMWKYKSETVDQFSLATTTYRRALWYASIVGFGAFLVGYHLGYSSPTETDIELVAGLSDSETDFVFSIMNIGAVAGCFLGIPLSDQWGRLKSLAIASIITVGGSILMAALSDPTFMSLFIARLSMFFSCFLKC
jgi:hypothetical protein